MGQDSHRFLPDVGSKPCIIGGVVFPDVPGLDADSDGDVIYHAICHAITTLTHVPILGEIAPKLCLDQGITDSRIYLEEALKTLNGAQIIHIALTLEGKRPRLQKSAEAIRQNVAEVTSLDLSQVGLAITSGDGLTAFGQGLGLQAFCLLTLSS